MVAATLLKPVPYSPPPARPVPDPGFLAKLRALAVESLHQMYVPDRRLYVFRMQRQGERLVPQGLSPRYTAIALLGLADTAPEAARHALRGHQPQDVCAGLVRTVVRSENLGDLALTLWAASRLGLAELDPLRNRILTLRPLERPYPTVELAWTLMAACADHKGIREGFAGRATERLLTTFNPSSGLFGHAASKGGARAHVCCFADIVYPIQALAERHRRAGDPRALAVAQHCAERAVRTQGPDGQWWWHFDCRTGEVVERYPVYTVHQHGMGPMALQALAAAGGPDYAGAIAKSLEWLACSPEIGGSTIDWAQDAIWRKVARREPRKLARRLQAAASYLHPALRIGGLDWALPAKAVDFECRPYELGWLLYAWPTE